MRSFFASAIAAIATAETVSVFPGLPAIDFTKADPEAVLNWAAGIDAQEAAIDQSVVTAWDVYVAAIQEPLAQLTSSVKTAAAEKDMLAA